MYYIQQKTDEWLDSDPSCWVGLVSPHSISTQQTCQQAAGGVVVRNLEEAGSSVKLHQAPRSALNGG